VTVANRTVAHAAAALLDGRWRAVGLEALADELATAEVVVSATRAPHVLISVEMVAAAMAGGATSKVIVDLAVPRDVEPAVRNQPGVTLVDVDMLQVHLDAGLAARRQAVPDVQAVIADELESWHQEMRELRLRPLVVELRRKAEQIRRQEVERTLRFLGDVDETTRGHIDHLSRALVNKLLHEPTMQIKALAQAEDPATHAAAIRTLFGLNHADGAP
jgi:glutamyl-tRNA reductase